MRTGHFNGAIHGLAHGDPADRLGDVEDGAKQMVQVGGGSGFLVHPDGLVLTNKHVVFDADAEYMVVMNDGSEHAAKVLSRDPINDIAVLKIEGKELPHVELASSDDIELGQTVLAIGNALGCAHHGA